MTVLTDTRVPRTTGAPNRTDGVTSTQEIAQTTACWSGPVKQMPLRRWRWSWVVDTPPIPSRRIEQRVEKLDCARGPTFRAFSYDRYKHLFSENEKPAAPPVACADTEGIPSNGGIPRASRRQY